MESKVPLDQCSQPKHEALSLNSGTEGTNPQLRHLNIISKGSLPNEDPGTVLRRSREEPARWSCSLSFVKGDKWDIAQVAHNTHKRASLGSG